MTDRKPPSNLLPSLGFMDAICKYYSQFLDTDFKKTRLPKRKIETKDRKGRRIGTPLTPFPKLIKALSALLNGSTRQSKVISVMQNQYTSELPESYRATINGHIEQVNSDELVGLLLEKVNEFAENIREDSDPELIRENFFESVHYELTRSVISPFIERLTHYFKETSVNALNQLIELDDQLSEFIIEPALESSADPITQLIVAEDSTDLSELVRQCFSTENLQQLLTRFFADFSVTDLYRQILDMQRTRSLMDNYDFYLYLGDIAYKKNSFPIFYIPLDLESGAQNFNLELTPRIFLNKKALEYVNDDLRKNDPQIPPLTLEDRIFYLEEDQSVLETIKPVFDSLMETFEIVEPVEFNTEYSQQRKSASVQISNKLSLAIFDKSDESMINDYEALLTGLEGGDQLRETFIELIDQFLLRNPESVDREIDEEWDQLDLSGKLIFESPVPLAEEQRKILSALKKDDVRFVSVEGPPGTGKSHTIAAIAFEQILQGKNLLILSDKKEALDVVEKFLDETLAKVRVGDDFQNPILRLGKQGTNYSRLLRTASIENIKTQLTVTRQNQAKIDQEKSLAVEGLRSALESLQSSYRALNKIPFGDYYDTEDELLASIDTAEIEFILENDQALSQLQVFDDILEFIQLHEGSLSDVFQSTFTPDIFGLEQLIYLHDLVDAWPDDKQLISQYSDLTKDAAPILKQFATQLESCELNQQELSTEIEASRLRRQLALETIEEIEDEQEATSERIKHETGLRPEELQRQEEALALRQIEENRNPVIKFIFRNRVIKRIDRELQEIDNELNTIDLRLVDKNLKFSNGEQRLTDGNKELAGAEDDFSEAKRRLADSEQLEVKIRTDLGAQFSGFQEIHFDQLKRVSKFVELVSGDLKNAEFETEEHFQYALYYYIEGKKFLVSESLESGIKEMSQVFQEDLFPLNHIDGEFSDARLVQDIRAELDAFRRLHPLHIQIKEAWSSVPDVDYLGEKQKVETYNAQGFASLIDERIVDFAYDYKADAKTLQEIIRKKTKFPTEKFEVMKAAFPCIIAGLRDYAEFIPLEREMFDLIIIDEGSQVSIAQALPAILRARKMVVLGDRQQFSNVKTSNSSKELNNSYMNEVMDQFKQEFPSAPGDAATRARKFDIHSSVMDFFEMTSNSTVRLKKHFRSYPELISFSSQYFYENGLQPMKIRAKPISDVIEFREIEHDGLLDPTRNTNQLEADAIIEELEVLVEKDPPPTVGIITPHTDQQELILRMITDHPRAESILKLLKVAVFTFDTCQGEERDVIIYSMVATSEKDRLNHIFARSLDGSNDDELDGKVRLQRLNVGFSRAKEKILFVHSKPIKDFTGSIKQALQHYSRLLESSHDMPDISAFDPNSPQEEVLYNYLTSTTFYQQYKDELEIKPQFPLGRYLASLDRTYTHPKYVVDFLITRKGDAGVQDLILEYDGAQFHFDGTDGVNAGNWDLHLSDADIEREKILESFGYKMLRVNKFNMGSDPVSGLDKRIRAMFNQLSDQAIQSAGLKQKNTLIEQIHSKTAKKCRKCGSYKALEEFRNPATISGYGHHCSSCRPAKSSTRRKQIKKPATAKSRKPALKLSRNTAGIPVCPVANHGAMIVKTRNNDGKQFYGCKKFPACRQTASF